MIEPAEIEHVVAVTAAVNRSRDERRAIRVE
jgi:hypothetical protein